MNPFSRTIDTELTLLSKQQQQKIVQYLNEAHGSELALVRQLQAQIAMTPRGQYRDGLETHLEETRRHAERVERRAGRAGAGQQPAPGRAGRWSRAVIGQALALTKTPLDLVRGSGGEEKVLKNAKDSCAAEALEIATYTALARLARTAGDAKTERLANSVLGDEQRMLDRLLREIPRLTDAVARAEFDGDGSYDVTETGAADAVREVRRHGQAHRPPGRGPGQAHRPPGPQGARRGACRGHGQGRRCLRVGSGHRELRLAQRRRDHRTSWPSSPRSTWPRSTPTSARTRTAPPSPAASTRCRRTSRGPATTSSAWTKSVPCSPRATRHDQGRPQLRAQAQEPRRRAPGHRARAQQRLTQKPHADGQRGPG